MPWKTKRDEATNEPFVLRSRLLLPLSNTFLNALQTYESFSCQLSKVRPRTQKELLKHGFDGTIMGKRRGKTAKSFTSRDR